LKGEADTDKNGTVSIIELYDFVAANVIKATNGKQNPMIMGKYDETLPMAVLRK
jgi:hypothetical protein